MLTTAFRTSTVWPDAGVKISPILQKSSLKVPTVNFFKIAKKIKILVNFCNNFCHPDVSKLAQSGHTLHGLATHTHTPPLHPGTPNFPELIFASSRLLQKVFFRKGYFKRRVVPSSSPDRTFDCIDGPILDDVSFCSWT